MTIELSDINVQEVAHHRNGVGGEMFHVVLFKYDGERYIATVFETKLTTAVICLDRISAHGVKFGANSHRGDIFDWALREVVREYDDEMLKRLA